MVWATRRLVCVKGCSRISVLVATNSPLLVIPSISVEEGKKSLFFSGWRQKLQFCSIWQISAAWPRGPFISYIKSHVFSQTQKSAKFINLRCLIFFNYHNLLMLQLPGFCCKCPYISQLLPGLFGAVPQSIWEAAFWAHVLSFVCQIKHNSQLLDCAFLFQSIIFYTRYS